MKKQTIDKIIVTLITIALMIFIALILFIKSLFVSKAEMIDVVIEEVQYEATPISYEIEEVEIDLESIRIQNYYKSLSSIDEIKTTSKMDWFIAYKKLNEQYSDLISYPNIYEAFSEEDIQYLQRMVETETHGADFESKTHVAAVALSRVINERFPDTLTKVITKPNQFCYGRKNISESTILACEYAYEIGTEVDGCLFFHSGAWKEKFNGADYVTTDKVGHKFYR